MTERRFLRDSKVDAQPMLHAWDDTDPEFAFVGLVPTLQRQLAVMSDRAVLALAVTFAEWIAFRLRQHTNERLLDHKIEAIWAGIVDFRYLATEPLPPRDEWKGPLRGPSWSAADFLDRTVDLVRRGQFASPEAICLSLLMAYITPKPSAFKKWRRFAIARLVELHPKQRDAPLGAPVPREALDPAWEYEPAMAPALIDSYLRGLDPSTNPFLASAKDMIASGFIGTPYRFG